jgi:hypothetical protein
MASNFYQDEMTKLYATSNHYIFLKTKMSIFSNKGVYIPHFIKNKTKYFFYLPLSIVPSLYSLIDIPFFVDNNDSLDRVISQTSMIRSADIWA